MSDVVETRGNYRARVVHDEDSSPFDPRNDSDLVEIVTPPLSRWDVRTKDAHFQEAFDRFEDFGRAGLFARWLKIFHGIHAYPVFMYEHSGVALSTGSFVGRAQHAQWDSGQIGWAYINPDAERWEGFDEEAIITCLVEELGRWMNGEVYGYIIERLVYWTKNYHDENGEELPRWLELPSVESGEEWIEEDSCWGYIGYEWAEQEAKNILDTYAPEEEAS